MTTAHRNGLLHPHNVLSACVAAWLLVSMIAVFALWCMTTTTETLRSTHRRGRLQRRPPITMQLPQRLLLCKQRGTPYTGIVENADCKVG